MQLRDENSGETVTRSEITTSFDDTIPHISGREEVPTPLVFNPFLNLSLEAFINREWYITEVNWASDRARSSLITVANLPEALYPVLGAKLLNIAYWAPDIEIVFKVNGTAMHYGRAIFAAVPSAQYLHSTYLQPIS